MIDLHTHSLFSDGELIPSELVRRAEVLGYRAIAITDHVDFSNFQFILENLLKTIEILNETMSITVIPGVEITHVSPKKIPQLIELCRKEGAKIVVVHGETLVEPVQPGTNEAAIEGKADILAHPGLISEREVEMAKENSVFLEITTRKGHSLTNGHVAKLATEIGAPLVINTDTHSPSDLVTREFAVKVGLGAGLTPKQVEECFANSERIIKNLTSKDLR
jgi:putative hydrolase